MSVLTTLNINEMFETIQGEGAHTGIPSIFVRLQGCPVGCPWCDTKHTWVIKPELGVDLLYPDYETGLAAILRAEQDAD